MAWKIEIEKLAISEIEMDQCLLHNMKTLGANSSSIADDCTCNRLMLFDLDLCSCSCN